MEWHQTVFSFFDRWHILSQFFSVIIFIVFFLALQFLELLFVLLLLLLKVPHVSLINGLPLFILRFDIVLLGLVLFFDALSFVLFKSSLVGILLLLEVVRLRSSAANTSVSVLTMLNGVVSSTAVAILVRIHFVIFELLSTKLVLLIIPFHHEIAVLVLIVWQLLSKNYK